MRIASGAPSMGPDGLSRIMAPRELRRRERRSPFKSGDGLRSGVPAFAAGRTRFQRDDVFAGRWPRCPALEVTQVREVHVLRPEPVREERNLLKRPIAINAPPPHPVTAANEGASGSRILALRDPLRALSRAAEPGDRTLRLCSSRRDKSNGENHDGKCPSA